MVGAFDGVPYSAKGMSIIKFRPRETQVYYQRDYYSEGDIMASIPGLDLAIAVACLVAFGTIPVDAVDGLAFAGELGLDGSIRRVPGVAPMVGLPGRTATP